MKSLMVLACGIIAAVSMAAQPAGAEPGKAQVIQLWEQQNNVKGRVLDLKSRGGQRPTNELNGKKYLTPVGTCWDYDLVELQKCGCRLFEKASVCCRRGSTKECEVRIGTTTSMVDCAKYGKPRFGLSGTVEPEECKVRKQAAACWSRKDLLFGPGVAIDPCTKTARSSPVPKARTPRPHSLSVNAVRHRRIAAVPWWKSAPNPRGLPVIRNGRQTSRRWTASGVNRTKTTTSAGSATTT